MDFVDTTRTRRLMEWRLLVPQPFVLSFRASRVGLEIFSARGAMRHFNSMASFTYVARDTGNGREIRNTVEAATEQAAILALLNRNLLVVSIQEKVGKK